jgi:hypothetical protein
MKKLGIILAVVIAVTIGLVWFLVDMRIDNQEKDLRKDFLAQYKVNKTSHDAMWKILSQDAGVVDKYATDFSERVLPALVEGRIGQGELMKWITESNPTFDASLYKELMIKIETERHKFEFSQNRTIDIQNQWNKLRENKPERWFIDSEFFEKGTDGKYLNAEVQQIMDYKPVTSTVTEDVFKSGVDDNVELFKK